MRSSRNKGRLVVRGDTQIPLIDYTATWAPVARYTTLRLLLAHCTSQDQGHMNLPIFGPLGYIQHQYFLNRIIFLPQLLQYG